MGADSRRRDTARIAVLGAGSWGTALAAVLCRNGHAVTLWARRASLAREIDVHKRNERYLPGVALPPSLAATPDMRLALRNSELTLIVVPTSAFRATVREFGERAPACPMIWACKGLEAGSGKFMHQVVAEELPAAAETGVISGPNFAAEVARGQPAATTVGSSDITFATRVSQYLHGEVMRAYPNSDVIGIELGGAIKNVLAIAAGISDGLGFGANARAALVTRGLAEIMRLGEALGARRETLMGLSGVGDLFLTCTDDLSRNRRLGLLLAQSLSCAQAVQQIGQAVEGVNTAREVEKLSAAQQVETPIATAVYQVVSDQITPREAVQSLLQRHLKPE